MTEMEQAEQQVQGSVAEAFVMKKASEVEPESEEQKTAEDQAEEDEKARKSFLSKLKRVNPFGGKVESINTEDHSLNKIMTTLGTDDPKEALEIVEKLRKDGEAKKTAHEKLLERQLQEAREENLAIKAEKEAEQKKAKLNSVSSNISNLILSKGVTDEKMRSLITRDIMSNAKLTEKGECYFEVDDVVMTEKEAVELARIEYKQAFPKQQSGPQTNNAGKVMDKNKEERYYFDKKGNKVPINTRGLWYHPFRSLDHISKLQILGNNPRIITEMFLEEKHKKNNPMN